MAFRTGNNPRICRECHATSKPAGSADLLSYPRFKGQRPLLTEFSHARHVDKLARVDARTGFRADCSHCHRLADDGKLASLPQHAECAACHSRPEIRPRLSAGAITSDCRACHSPEEIEKPSVKVASNVWPNIEFSHLVHLRSRKEEKLDCIAVEFRTHFFNQQSRRGIERLGAKQDGILRSHMIAPNGTLRDTVVYSIIAGEWPTVKAHLNYQLNDKPR